MLLAKREARIAVDLPRIYEAESRHAIVRAHSPNADLRADRGEGNSLRHR